MLMFIYISYIQTYQKALVTHLTLPRQEQQAGGLGEPVRAARGEHADGLLRGQ